MPHVNYEHVDHTTRCSLGREFQMYQQSTAREQTVCDICSQAVRVKIVREVKSVLDYQAFNNPGMPKKPEAPPQKGPPSLEG